MRKEKEMFLADYPFPDTRQAERQVLVDAVNNVHLIGEIADRVTPDMFTDDRQKIWKAVMDKYNAGDQIDLATVNQAVGQAFIDEVIRSGLEVGMPTAVVDHVNILVSAHYRRKAYAHTIALLALSAKSSATKEDLASAITSMVNDLQLEASTTIEAGISKVLDDIREDLVARKAQAAQGEMFRVPTGFPTLDWLLYNGFRPGQLIVLAARPSIGKTSVMLHMAKAAAMNGFPVNIHTLEMTNAELGSKLLYSTGQVRPFELASAEIGEDRLTDASRTLSGLPIIVNDRSRNLNEIVSRIAINRNKGRCRIAFIDYLGLIKGEADARTPLYQAIGEITATLKVTAKRMGIPIVLLCQLSRDIAKDGRAPQLYDLRDSGSIEQDADIVLMLEQKKAIAPEGEIHINMWLRKNRQGKKDYCITLRPNDTYSEFDEIGTTQS